MGVVSHVRQYGRRVPETLIVERADGVVSVTMNRPERKNAANDVMWNDLLATFREVAASPTDRVMVLTGAGDAFCSGADVGGMKERTDGDDSPRPHSLDRMRHIGDVVQALHRIPQPTIAKVRGIAAGAGLNMALMCDLTVASDNARFSEIFARRGLTLDFGGSWILPRRVGIHRAKELALFADIIDAAEADRIGLVNRVVADAELDDFVAEWAARLASQAPIAIAQSKRLLDSSSTSSLAAALEAEGAAQSINFTTSDTAEAVSAFLEKRQPTFRGN